MFRGQFQHSLDIKGRVVIPVKFREGIGDVFFITRTKEKCLLAYTEEEWSQIEKTASELPMTDPEVKKYIRMFIGNVAEVEPDAQGRIVIPQNLRDHAGLIKDIIYVGMANHIEIWSKEEWDSQFAEDEPDDQSQTEKMVRYGFRWA